MSFLLFSALAMNGDMGAFDFVRPGEERQV